MGVASFFMDYFIYIYFMKKIILIGMVILSLSACSKKKPFDSIKKGMTKEKVSALIGEPEQKMPMFIMEW